MREKAQRTGQHYDRLLGRLQQSGQILACSVFILTHGNRSGRNDEGFASKSAERGLGGEALTSAALDSGNQAESFLAQGPVSWTADNQNRTSQPPPFHQTASECLPEFVPPALRFYARLMAPATSLASTG
ncbi:hypothetical protein BO78DRAFT_425011 [Aspergillus sclerotiicarbonarius CBS 121057]|uniref:Uncharacterized protein n=1 Tax=Aspergillus sclerotiicarbonarius (strain CBS 121057 / IBT 28362) TaxID=1448318 RepID=A0A319ESZ4_ASPSB|nr:hypothetical protein BO78DRAFT_425011 [Aspergillus sclerotiicarbonarius CBS 121057]